MKKQEKLKCWDCGSLENVKRIKRSELTNEHPPLEDEVIFCQVCIDMRLEDREK